MIAYEVYRLVPGGEDRLLGILPERRKNRERITKESVMKWARLLVSDKMTEEFFNENLYFISIPWPVSSPRFEVKN